MLKYWAIPRTSSAVTKSKADPILMASHRLFWHLKSLRPPQDRIFTFRITFNCACLTLHYLHLQINYNTNIPNAHSTYLFQYFEKLIEASPRFNTTYTEQTLIISFKISVSCNLWFVSQIVPVILIFIWTIQRVPWHLSKRQLTISIFTRQIITRHFTICYLTHIVIM